MMAKPDSGLGPSDGLFNLQNSGNTDLRMPLAVGKANITGDLNLHQFCCCKYQI